MGWRVWGEQLTTADFSGTPRVYQAVKFNSDIILRACRTWIIFYNDPAITSVQMRIYSNNGGVPGKLIHTSTNTLTKAECITLQNGVKEVYFDFNFPVFKAEDTYHFVLWGNGYTGDSTSHVAWMRGFPDPVHTAGISAGYQYLLRYPFQIYFIGSEL